MDPVSLSASIIAFIQIADSVIGICKHCIDSIKDAPKDMQMILGEATSLRAIIESFNAADLHANTLKLVPSLFESAGPIEACRRCLFALERLLPQQTLESQQTRRSRITFAELAWPLKESKARKLLAEISQHKATLLLIISGDMMHDIRDIKSGVQRIEHALTDVQRQEISRWLESTNPSPIHNGAFSKHETHTSAWLLQSPEWASWLTGTGPGRFLWIHGIPGAGKTVLASFIIEQLKEFCEDNVELGQAYYYCHYSHNQDEAAPFLRWIIGQLCRQVKWVPQPLRKLHDQGCDPSIPELENALEAVQDRFKRVYLVIDAVDESFPREDLVTVIATMVLDKRFRNLRILATSRLYFDIEMIFSGISTAISMSNPLVEEDIRMFVHSRLTERRMLRRWLHLHPEIENALVSGAQGMFRWAECQIDALERLRNETQIRQALSNLPKDLAETYVRIFEAIPEQDRQFVRRVLIWIRGHEMAPWIEDQGIRASLLLSAASYDPDEPESLPRYQGYDCNYLKELCGCLITVSAAAGTGHPTPILPSHDGEFRDTDAHEDEQKSTAAGIDLVVFLAHYTVTEFLFSEFIFETKVSYFALSEETALLEFASSVLRQALDADPAGMSADWINDREAYCLTLAGALFDADNFDVTSDILQLFTYYFDPTRPHFRRLPVIQQRILSSDDDSQFYILQYLPIRIRSPNSLNLDTSSIHAATLLNILAALGQSADLAQRFLMGKHTEDILNTKLSATWLLRPRLGSGLCQEATIEGTIPEIIQQLPLASSVLYSRMKWLCRWIANAYGEMIDSPSGTLVWLETTDTRTV